MVMSDQWIHLFILLYIYCICVLYLFFQKLFCLPLKGSMIAQRVAMSRHTTILSLSPQSKDMQLMVRLEIVQKSDSLFVWNKYK